MTIKASSYPTSRPTLDLNFAQTKRLDPRVTFTRSSTGSYFDANGVLQSAATNTARFDHNPATGESLGLLVEESRTNSIQYSQQLHLKTTGGTTAQPYATVSPDGTSTATLVTETTLNGAHSLELIGTTTFSSNATLTAKAYLKNAGARYVALIISDGFVNVYGKIFDLQLGTVGANFLTAPVSSSIKPLPNGWYECVITATVTGYSTANSSIFLTRTQQLNYAGDGVSGAYIWGAQLEVGSFPTSYIPTPATFTSRASSATYYDASGVIQTAGTNVARSAAFFPDSNGTMRSAGLLLEAAGTNLLQYSEQINTSPWTLNNSASVSANSSVAPDGQTTADTLSGAATSSYVEQTIPWSASGNWTLSFFAKAGTSSRNKIYIVRSASQVHGTNIDWSSGVPSFSTTFGCTTQSEKIGNGWYRISLLLTSVDHTATNFLRITSDFISGTGTVLLWGFQAEQNSYPTSYIATTTATVTRSADVSSSATVTRSADVASITGTNFSSWYNGNQGSFFALCDHKRDPSYNMIIEGVGSGTPMDFSMGAAVGNPNFVTRYPYTSLNVVSVGGPIANDTLFKLVGVYSSAGTAVSLNGGAVQTTGGSQPVQTPATSMTLGYRTGGSLYLNGHLSRLTYWPTRLSDATLQAITR